MSEAIGYGEVEQQVAEGIGAYDEGFVALFRKLLSSSLWMMRPEDLKLAIYLLLRANWKDQQWFNKWQYKRITVRRGELVTSLESIAIGTKMSKKTIRTSIKHLVSDGFIKVLNSDEKRARQFSHIKICKYETYQDVTDQAGTARAQHGHGIGTARATNEQREPLKQESIDYSDKLNISVPIKQRKPRRKVADPPPLEIEQFREITQRYPKKVLWPFIIEKMKAHSVEQLKAWFIDWTSHGWNEKNLKWMDGNFNNSNAPRHKTVSDFSEGF